MEIYFLRSTGTNFHNNTEKHIKEIPTRMLETAPKRHELFVDHLERANSEYTRITPRQLREIANASLEAGVIDQSTHRELVTELPMEAIDHQGRLLDLSAVGDETPFDFQDYYRGQLMIAETLGDSQSADVLRSVVAFLET